MNNQQTIRTLLYLYRIIESGEKGYAVAAANVSNPGLKVLFKSYAQQRARYKAEILAELSRLGNSDRPRSSFRGALHRGRIDIFAAMTIGKDEREMVVLKEVNVGEKVALHTYENALKRDLPDEICEVIAQQYAEVQKTVECIHLMRGKQGKRLVVKLFENTNAVEGVVRNLQEVGFHLEEIESLRLGDAIQLYDARGTTVSETVISGSVGGALWGNVIGALAGFGAQSVTHLDPFGTASSPVWYLFALAGIAAGALIGGMLGFAIGVGISEEDTYRYDQSMKNGHTILLITVDITRASAARHILEHGIPAAV